ncbi:hypothetical protein [Escherichia coli]|uniref:hypothetical protein n=1 Tax=Escherichia coli TaxID=562 RepID=UPI00333AA533
MSAKVDRITEDCGQQQRLSLASAPSFKWYSVAEARQSSTSISSSVILMRGSNWLVFGRSAPAPDPAPPHPAG